MDKMPVHITTLDGKTVKTTWAKTRTEAQRIAEDFRSKSHNAGLVRIFTDGGLAKYRIVAYFY